MHSHIHHKNTPKFDGLLDTLHQKLTAQLIQPTTANFVDLDNIDIIIDGKNYACPMPLLKVKLALKSLADGSSIYLIASDINATKDIAAFCQKNHHTLLDLREQPTEQQDTFFHFIIIKNTGV